MIIQVPSKPNDILVVMDQRSKYDREHSEVDQREYVGDGMGLCRDMIGQHWNRCTRICLYDYGQKPKPKERASARSQYKAFIKDYQPKVIVVLPTPPKAMKQNNTVMGTQVWRDLNPPDSMDDMRGSFWDRDGSLVLPVFYPTGAAGQINLAFMNRWMRAAVAVAAGKAKPMVCADKHIQVGPDMAAALASMVGKPIALDIETIPNSNTITAIGVSDGITSVSVPFDGYEPACGSGYEPALASYGQMGAEVRQALTALLAASTPKILQNGVFDLPQLEARGFTIGGQFHDTLAMHAITYPEARHGLQLAAASEMIIPPWKSLFHPKGLKRDQPEFWYWNADMLRDYNADDAFYTFHLAKNLAWKVGITL